MTNRLSSWESPTWRDRIAWLVGDTVGALGASNQTQRRFSNSARSWIDMVPVLNDAVGIDETGRALAEGNYREAAMKGIPTAFGLIPGGGDFAAPIAKAIFAGIGAKTANRELMKTAEKMAGEGASRESIWDATGWFKGPDDKWRFEIDDSTSQFRGVNPEPQPTPIRAALKHPELYEAYSDMIPATVREETMTKGAHGRYSAPDTGGGGEMIGLSRSAKDPHSTVLHEVQHGVQHREGFASGGNDFSVVGHSDPEIRKAFNQKVEALLAPIPKEKYFGMVGAGWPEATKAQLETSYKGYLKDNKKAHGNLYHPTTKAAMETASMDVYKRMAGEVEARNVQKRMNMTPEQRRATPPWATQDVPDGLQIVRRR